MKKFTNDKPWISGNNDKNRLKNHHEINHQKDGKTDLTETKTTAETNHGYL